MVSKLVLAINETYHRGGCEGASADELAKLAGHYEETRDGIGLIKNPAVYGGFPMDPYSHTPGDAGVQQPGMTGQVKEDILARWGELGVHLKEGALCFSTSLLPDAELQKTDSMFTYVDAAGAPAEIPVRAGELAFTICQVPIVYRRGRTSSITIFTSDGHSQVLDSPDRVPSKISASIFGKEGRVARIEVDLGNTA